MNIVMLLGRLTADPDVRTSQSGTSIATYTLAVDRRTKDKSADFIRCKAFNNGAEFAERYFRKGMRVSVQGHIQTGSYTNREGRKVYTTDVIVDQHEFAQSKAENGAEATARPQERQEPQYGAADEDGFMHVPDDIDEELPFN